jgi:hypothetical protein
MALSPAKRPSELAALLCDGILFRWEGVDGRFVPSCLTETDRPGLLAPPFYVKSWKEVSCVCPVETVRLFLLEGLVSVSIMSQCSSAGLFPHRPLNAAAIGRCLQFCLVKAGFSATPASSRSIAASAALAGNASLGDVLRLGAWSDASSYFRFYHAL